MTSNFYPFERPARSFGFGDAFHDVAFNVVLLRAEGGVLELGVEVGVRYRSRARLVVVVDEVDLFRAAVGGAMIPVVDHHIADIEPPGVAVDELRMGDFNNATENCLIFAKCVQSPV